MQICVFLFIGRLKQLSILAILKCFPRLLQNIQIFICQKKHFHLSLCGMVLVPDS